MEYCDNGDLEIALAAGGGMIPRPRLFMWAIQAADALNYLHKRSPPIIHRDIKLKNILLDKNSNARLCDFGLARQDAGDRDMTRNVGTVLKTIQLL